MQYHQSALAHDLQRLAKKDPERSPPGRLSSFTSTSALHHSSSTTSMKASASSRKIQAPSAYATSGQASSTTVHHHHSATIELNREDALQATQPLMAQESISTSGTLLRHPESQRLLLTGSSWGWMSPNGAAAADSRSFGGAASMFSDSAVAFRELRRLVLSFLTGPDSRLFRSVDGLEATDDELDELLVAGGSFTLYHLQKLNLLNAQMAAFSDLVKVVRFLSRESLTARERLFAYLNQHHVVSATGIPARVCSLFSAPSSYSITGMHVPPQAPSFHFSSSLSTSGPAIPSFSWSDIDSLYIEGLAGDATLECVHELEDANPHLRLNETTPRAMCARLAQLIKERYLASQSTLMKRLGSRYAAVELDRYLEGFEEFLASQHGSKAHAQMQAEKARAAAAAAAAMAQRGGGLDGVGLHPSFSPSFGDHPFSYLDPLVAYLSSPSTLLFSSTLPIRSDDVRSLVEMCYDDVDRCGWYLRRMNENIARCTSGGAPWPGVPSSRLHDVNELKLAVYKMVQQDDQRKVELAEWLNRTERGRKLVVRDSSPSGTTGGLHASSSSSLPHGGDASHLLSMSDVEYLYRATWSAVAHASAGRGSLVNVLSRLPSHLRFSDLGALVQYLLKQQSQQEVQARARGRAKDRAEVVASSSLLAELLPRSARTLQLTQTHIDSLLMAARSNRIDLAVHPVFNLAHTEHPTQTGRYLNASTSAASHSGVFDGFDPHSLYPPLELHLRFLLSARRSFDSFGDLVQAIEMCARQTDQMVATMHEYLTTPARRGGGKGIFENVDRHAKPNSFDVDGLSHADMYLLLLLSSAGLSSFLILQRLSSLRSLPGSAQLSFQSTRSCVAAGVDAVSWPVKSLEELIGRVRAMWRAKYAPREDAPGDAGGEGEEEWSKYEEEFKQQTGGAEAFIVGGAANASRGYKPPVFDNVFTALSASAYTPAEDSEHLIHRRHRPGAAAAAEQHDEGSEWQPEDRIRLYEFLTRPECRLLNIPGTGGSSADLGAPEEKSTQGGVSTLPPLSRAMLHSLLAAGGGLQQTLALLRSLESSHRSFPSFSLLLSSLSSSRRRFTRLVETMVYLMRTYKGRRSMRDCLAREGEGKNKQHTAASADTELELELELSSSNNNNSGDDEAAFPIELEEHPRGILLSDEAMMDCMMSWSLSLLPRLGHQLSILYYTKQLLGMNGSVPTGVQGFQGLDGLADVLQTLYQRDLARQAASSSAIAFDPRSRLVVELTPEEERWLEEEPTLAASVSQSRPMTASHRLTVSNQPASNSTLLAHHTSFDPLALPSSTLGYSNSCGQEDGDMFSPSHPTSHGLSSEDAREFFTAFSPPGHAARMRLGAPAHSISSAPGAATAGGEMDHHDPFFVQLVRQQEAEAEEIMRYLKSGRSRLLDSRAPATASSAASGPAASPRSVVVSSLKEGNVASRTATLATPSLVSTLQRSGGLGPLTVRQPRHHLARYLHLILRSTSRWLAEQARDGRRDREKEGTEETEQGTGNGQPSESGFNSLDVGPSVHHSASSSPSALLSTYEIPSFFTDFTNSPTLHLLQQLDIMETRFVSSTARASPNGVMSPLSPATEETDHSETLHRLKHFGFSEMESGGEQGEVDAPNVSLLAQVIANRKAKAVAIHSTVFRTLTPEDQATGVLGPVSPVYDPSVHPPAARDAPPSLSAYLSDLSLLDHPSCRWIDCLPLDPAPEVDMVPSGTIPSYLVPKKKEEDYVDGSDVKPEPIAKQDEPPSFRQSAINLSMALLKFDDTLERRVEAVVSLDTPLLELISTLQNLQPQLGLVNTLLALSAKRDGPPLINRQQLLAPSPASVPHAAAVIQQQQDEFELNTVADIPFPEKPHPSFLNVLQPLLSGLHAHLVAIQSLYTRDLPAWFHEIHPLMQWMREFYPALYEALRAAQYVGTTAPQASTAQHPLHPHLMLMLPLLQGAFHLLAEFLTRRSAQQLHPALFRLEAYSSNLAQFLLQLHPLSSWLHRLLRAPDAALSLDMRRMRDDSLEEYRAFILNLPGFLAKLAPFVTAMQTHLRAYLPFASALQTQYTTFVRPLLLPILPLLLPMEQDKGITYAPLALEEEEELELHE